MADPDRGSERRAAGTSRRDERGPLERHPGLEILAPAELDRVRERVDPRYVARRAGGDAEAPPLADRVARPSRRARRPASRRRRGSVRAPDPSRLARAGRRGSRRPARSRSPGSRACRPWRGRARAPRRGPRASSARRAGSGRAPAGPRAGRTGSRSGPCPSSRRPQQPRPAVAPDLAPRVVPGRDGLAVVQVPRPAEQRPELHVRVAVDARARRPAVEVRVEERLRGPRRRTRARGS